MAGFIFFFLFSPSFGPALLYYQTDTLGFSQQVIGAPRLAERARRGGRRAALRVALAQGAAQAPDRLAIGIAVVGTLAYLGYRSLPAAVAIDGGLRLRSA